MGTDAPASLDNERPAHLVDVPAFWIDAAPVTNGQFRQFVEAGGYDEPRWWGERGWAWREEADLVAPQFWRRDGAAWSRLRFGIVEPAAGRRTGAARRLARGGRVRTMGRAAPPHRGRVGEGRSVRPGHGGQPPVAVGRRRSHRRATPTSVSATSARRRSAPTPLGVSAVGCHQMVGDVWEWTSSDFLAYPGFEWFPYAEYSDVFYGGDYKVLRGSSWATHASVGRTTFRNWDHPIRRQIFAGFRTARDC